MYKITLTIPTFNRAEELPALLESVARQTLDPALWECILIDNHSTDHTAEVVEAFCQAHPQLHIRRVVEPMAGVSYARNRGLREAATDLVCSVDDDERINPHFLAAYLDFFTSHPEAVVAGGKIIAEYPDGRPRWMSRWTERPIANPIDLGEKIRPFPRGMLPGGGNMGYRLSVARQFGFLTETSRWAARRTTFSSVCKRPGTPFGTCLGLSSATSSPNKSLPMSVSVRWPTTSASARPFVPECGANTSVCAFVRG